MDWYLIDWSCPIEILWPDGSHKQIEQLVQDVNKIMKNGLHPVRVDKGMSGVYCFKNTEGESVAIVKPADEEPYAPNNPKGIVGRAFGQPGLRDSIRVGESVYREAAVYLLDYGHFANVPHTALVKICRSAFNVNDEASMDNRRVRASIQQFIPRDFDASDYGTSSFPVTAVHRIGILDIRTFNTDRHGGNLLVKKHNDNGVERLEIIPIDHGLCLPENLEDPYFEWLYWPQASIPFMEEELKYIEALDPYGDADMLKNELPVIRKGCHRVLILSTIFLKEAAAYGLTLSNIGEMMTRSRFGEEPSKLEQLCMAAMDGVRERDSFDNFMNQSVLSAHNLDTMENEVAAGSGFVKLEDIKEEIWADFLDKFQTLLYPAFEIL